MVADPQGPKTRLQTLIRGMVASRIGLLGAAITTVSAALIVGALVMSFMGIEFGPYQGLVTYLLLPTIFVGGLILIPLGSWLVWRRARRTGQAVEGPRPFIIDLSRKSHRRFWGSVAFLSIVNVSILAAISYKGYHYTESTQFCGTLCHSVMEPEYTAYNRSPHARVDCVACHIGPGASWFVKSKLSGLRQVYGVIFDDFSRPVPTPIHDLRPARDTCEQCHWPEVFHGNRIKVFEKAKGEDGAKDPTITAVALHVGGRSARTGQYHGIHWHVSEDNLVEYRDVDDKRLQIKELRVTRPDGTRETFVKEDLPEVPADKPWRAMDCIDCHNRPTHVYESPYEAVDRLLLTGRLPGDMPELRNAGLKAIQKEYPTKFIARAQIPGELLMAYREKEPDVSAEDMARLAKAGEVLFAEAYAVNVYPRLNIGWGTYPSHLGHKNDLGCFRCHDDEHENAEGKTVSQDCDTCHQLLVEDERLSEIDEGLRTQIFFEHED